MTDKEYTTRDRPAENRLTVTNILLAIVVILGGFMGDSISAFADTATITYDAPTEREDNSPLSASEIAGFKVYNADGVEITALPSTARAFDVNTTQAIQTLFITTIDTDGRESAYSQQATIPATVADPKPPTVTQVTVSP